MDVTTNLTALPKLSTLIDDVIIGVVSKAGHKFHQQPLATFWEQTFENISNESLKKEETEPQLFSPARIAVIACVIIGLFVLTWGSYTVHRKCIRDSWRHKYSRAMRL